MNQMAVVEKLVQLCDLTPLVAQKITAASAAVFSGYNQPVELEAAVHIIAQRLSFFHLSFSVQGETSPAGVCLVININGLDSHLVIQDWVDEVPRTVEGLLENFLQYELEIEEFLAPYRTYQNVEDFPQDAFLNMSEDFLQ